MKLRKGRAFAALAVIAALTVSGVSCAGSTIVGSDNSVKQNDTAVYSTEEGTSSPDETAEASTEQVQQDKVVHVLAAGDNLIHYSVYKNAEAYAENGEAYNFAPIYENVRYLVESADVAILNQETIISESNEVRGANGGAL